MKDIIFVIICMMFLTGCGNTNDQKAEQLVNQYEQVLVKPYGGKGFKPLGRVKLDSAEVKLPYRKEAQEMLAEMHKASKANASAYSDLKKGVTNIVSYNIMVDELRQSGLQAQSLQNKINAYQKNYNPRIPGWMASHRFRVIQKNGYIKLFEYIFYFDSGITRINGIICLTDSIPLYQPL
jgi:uncharacterized lipoprotein YehR (DUF1307 family)